MFSTPIKGKNMKKGKVPLHKIRITPDHADGLYTVGEKATFKVEYFRKGKTFPGQKIEAFFHHMDYSKKSRKRITFLSGRSKKITIRLERPASTILEVILTGKSGAPLRRKNNSGHREKLSFSCGVLASPEKCLPAREEPSDFDAFWEAEKKKLASIPLEILEKCPVCLPEEAKEKFLAWDMKISCAGPAPVSGYLTMPEEAAEGKKKLPVVVSYHGGGVRSSVLHFRENAITFDVNAHGIVNGKEPEYYLALSRNELKDYIHRGQKDRETYYFRWMYLRIFRSLEFVRTLPEWNGKDLIVVGGSQGGAQTLVAAGMDPHVTLAHSWVPAICNLNNFDKRRPSSWPWPFCGTEPGKEDWEKVASCVPYFDAVNFARRIHCEIFLSAGLLDTICPPENVFAAWNVIPSSGKSMYTHYDKGHLEASNPLFPARLEEILSGKK